MSDKFKEFPRDLRALCGGFEIDADGACYVLLDPVLAYANAVEVRRELEREILDPDTHPEDIERIRKYLEFVRLEVLRIKKRILDHFKPRAPSNGKGHLFPSVDSSVKNKVEKLIVDVEAGTYEFRRHSRTLQAVRTAIAFLAKKGRMPSPSELMDFGYNTQQATDAGKWFALMADRENKEESLFPPLRDGRGRPKKN